MSIRVTRSFTAQLGDFLALAGTFQATSSRSLDDCILALRENRESSGIMGGFNSRLNLSRPKAAQNDVRFEIEYYRQSYRSGRSTHMVQRLRGVLYRKDGQTHVVAKVRFTGAALRWLWLAIALTAVGVGLLLYTGNIIMFLLIGMTGSFLLAMVLVLWLDRRKIIGMVRRSIGE